MRKSFLGFNPLLENIKPIKKKKNKKNKFINKISYSKINSNKYIISEEDKQKREEELIDILKQLTIETTQEYYNKKNKELLNKLNNKHKYQEDKYNKSFNDVKYNNNIYTFQKPLIGVIIYNGNKTIKIIKD